jgi:hypothetical protein
VPLVGTLAAAAIFGEPLGPRQLISMALTLSGVMLALKRAVVQRSEARHIWRPSNCAMNLIGMLSVDELFKGRHFDREIIVPLGAVWIKHTAHNENWQA